jgi:ParB family chromosome partitioning protein
MSVKEQPKRLGRGLAALLGEAAAPVALNAPGVSILAIDLLEPSPFQPRRDMDEEALAELAESILSRGILQPLLVRPKPGVEGKYQIIAGERRWRAAQKASLHEVPVLVRALSDTDAMAAGLVENLQRKDLNPVEEALGYQRLMVEFKVSQDELGKTIGKSRAHIGNVLRLLTLPERALEMVRDGSLSFGHARALVGQADAVKLAKLFIERNYSVRQAEEYVNDLGRTFKGALLNKPPPKSRELATSDVRALSESLSERLGVKVKISFNGKGGSVVMNYRDLDQLDGIMQLLNA